MLNPAEHRTFHAPEGPPEPTLTARARAFAALTLAARRRRESLHPLLVAPVYRDMARAQLDRARAERLPRLP